MITLKDVSYRYEGSERLAISNLSLTLKNNEWVAILGQNGSGKSTLGRLFNGLLTPVSGTVKVDGFSTSDESSLWEVRKRVGMVFQNPDHQFVATTVRDDIAFGLENRGIEREEMLRRIDLYSKQVGVNQLLDKEPHRLSGGQKQRVAIAGIIALEPDFIIFDEATSMLDPIGRLDVLKTMRNLHKQGLSILSITHDMEEAALSDRVVVLNQGTIIEDGSPSNVFRSVEWIGKAGLAMPFSLKLQKELESQGVTLDTMCLSEKELVDSLWTYSSKK
ncbi:energy-coupling factor transporter ATPase [Bacillus solitudinis]|uniref:energy-coupling factor transporter ATPase n=1 Tax=Bacillus solitudinis TaxID=2014074 RepID=UPI000C2361F0|nr:energy-coupling factor transporter ATPase [Bacillus solitudinis]